MELGSEKVIDTDEGDELVGISKSGSKVETVGMLSSRGGPSLSSCCEGERVFGAVGVTGDSSKYS
jgi:hypothetical protein